MVLVNARSAQTIASEVELAVTRAERRRGLLGKEGLEASAGLMISPCWAIHTTFMRFPIDVVFLDRGGRAVRIVRDLAPWRIAIAPRAHAVVELPAGRLRTRDVRIGDTLDLGPGTTGAPGEPAAPRH